MHNMKRIYGIIAITLFLAGTMAGCADEDLISIDNKSKGLVVEMNILDSDTAYIQSRASVTRQDCYIERILAVVVDTDGKLRGEDCVNSQIVGNSTQSQKLTFDSINPLMNVKLYLFCNTNFNKTALDSIDTEEILLQTIKAEANPTKIPMFGQCVVGETTIVVDLVRSVCKSTLSLDQSLLANKYAIVKWGLAHLTREGYVASGQTVTLPAVKIDTMSFAIGEDAFFNEPQSVQNTSFDRNRICAFVQLKDSTQELGWFRLDFYKEDSWIFVKRNTHYNFKITSVKSKGYLSLEEALDNVGSNIGYKIEVADLGWQGNSVNSNGQYSLKTNKNEILYSTSMLNTEISNALIVKAFIPKDVVASISTYKAKIVNGNGQVKFKVGTSDSEIIDLLPDVESDKEISLNIKGVIPENCYIEVRLGNIVKQVAFTLVSANSYLVNWGSRGTPDNFILIPIRQANLDGNIRIQDDEIYDAKILWSDQSTPVSVETVQSNKSIKVIPKSNFIGNVIVAVTVNGKIKWSWHIWSLTDDDLSQDAHIPGIYTLKTEKTHTYSGLVWMDRNLGAHSTNYDLSARGLMYQWGRKDPFPTSKDWWTSHPNSKEVTTYYKGELLEIASNVIDTRRFPTESGQNNLEISIENPMTYLLSNELAPFDWYTDIPAETNNNLWLSIDNSKTPYDPCPYGWRVPWTVHDIGPWIEVFPEQLYKIESNPSAGLLWNNGKTTVYFPTVLYYDPLGTGFSYYAEGPMAYASITGARTGKDRYGYLLAGSSISLSAVGDPNISYTTILKKASGQYIRCVRDAEL